MLVVGLTGGIGSGKSTFAALLVERGARLIDADLLAHDALRPGRPSWHSVVDQFGDEILVPGSMEIDRKRLGRIVFASPEKRAALNAIVHPVIFKGIADRLDEARSSDDVVVIDAALIFETGLHRAMDLIVAVVSTRQERTRRLTEDRGMRSEEIDARMAAQMDPLEMESRADIVVRNNGSLEELARDADRVWKELEARNAT